jgi:Calcineurin-like phosphoesterase
MIRLVSDVHTEFLQPRKALALMARFAPLPGERVLVLAGDIGKVLNSHGTLNTALTDVLLALRTQRTDEQYIVIVPGNHEYYGAAKHGLTADVVDAFLERWCVAHGIVFLQMRTWTLPGTDVVFAGCTLWSDATDMALDGCNDVRMALASRDVYHDLHIQHVAWLTWTLPQLQGRVVVVTHHLPTRASVHPVYAPYSPLESAYATDLPTRLFQAPVRLWLHGHSHESMDVRVGSVRVLSNPTGYPGERKVTAPADVLIDFPKE